MYPVGVVVFGLVFYLGVLTIQFVEVRVYEVLNLFLICLVKFGVSNFFVFYFVLDFL